MNVHSHICNQRILFAKRLHGLEHALTAPDIRINEILDRIEVVFSEKGFDGASMQDLARAAVMSAGNFYRYFPSKAAIIEALVQRNLEETELDFQRIKMASDPHLAVRDLIRKHVEYVDCAKGPIWAEIEATAFRRPEIAALLARMQSQICRNIVGLFAHVAGVGEPEAEQRFGAQAKLIFLLINAYTVSVSREAANGVKEKSPEFQSLVIAVIENTVNTVISMAHDAMLAPALEKTV